ncbi:phage tail sheath subtilisin-like domain-containing protein [Nocardioides salsibiostraticola]
MALTPVQTSYPGVYVVEVPSGVRTLTGVATSITAFVGRALRGPVDDPVTIGSYGDFERVFGGLWTDSHLGYSVSDFFRLGGGAAIIVRVHRPAADDTATLGIGAAAARLGLRAANPGAWGSRLVATVDKLTADPADTTQFNLTVTDNGTFFSETFRNVSFATDSSRRVDLVLESSTLVRIDGALPTDPQASDSVDSSATTGGNNGAAITAAEISTTAGMQTAKLGMYALEKADLFNLLVIPPYSGTGDIGDRDVDATVVTNALAYVKSRRAVAILDAPTDWTTSALAVTGAAVAPYDRGEHAALYFPRIKQPDPLRDGQVTQFAPSGAIAGLIADTDAKRGVWKSPAGLDTNLAGVAALAVPLTDFEIGLLNPLGINCLRLAPGAGHVVWGARTRDGSDRLASDWKYLAVRRTALFLEESLYRGLQWAVFEPNDEPLWAQVRLGVGAFMNNLFRQGAFQGSAPKDAYFVKCDRDTTTQNDINSGVVNIQVGFAPLKPAEFVVLRLQQMAGQINV